MWVVMLVGCRARQEIELPTTEVLASRHLWGVVVSRYARIHIDQGRETEIRGYLRRGEIVELVRQNPIIATTDNQDNFWYFVRTDQDNSQLDGQRNGWIFGSDMETYATRGRAINSSRLLRQSK